MNTSGNFIPPLNSKFLLQINDSNIGTGRIQPGIIIETERELAVFVDGDSMSPVLQHLDIALIDKYATYQNGDIVIAIFENGAYIIKRYRKSMITESSNIRFIYRVVQSLRNLDDDKLQENEL